jgi:SAM-dependent methyltransferase
MAKRGFQIVAIELGAHLAAIARRNLAAYENARVETGAFEDWPLPTEPFDLVFAATSFHWLDHDVALPKVAAALRPGGAIAVIGGGHVAGGDMAFFHDVQDCFERYMPGTTPGLRLPPVDDVPRIAPEIAASGLFAPAQYRRYTWLRKFTTETYLGELSTYSNHIALSHADREALFACIAARIDRDYGGQITKAYLTELVVAALP